MVVPLLYKTASWGTGYLAMFALLVWDVQKSQDLVKCVEVQQRKFPRETNMWHGNVYIEIYQDGFYAHSLTLMIHRFT
jgi:hypothetical protein